jgi:hypothetical protein
MPDSSVGVGIEEDNQVAWYLEHAIKHISQAHNLPWSDDLIECVVRTLTCNSVVLSGNDGGQSAPQEYVETFRRLDIVQRLGVIKPSTTKTPQLGGMKVLC